MMAISQNFNQFLILLYKGILLRRQHYIVTIFEILVPILVCSIPAIFISQAPGPYSSRHNDFNLRRLKNTTTFPPFSPYERFMYADKFIFLYSPNTTASYHFISEARKLWQSKLRRTIDVSVEGFNTEEELEDKAITLLSDNIVIGTVFQNLPQEISQLPSAFNYKIRYKSSQYGTFHTDSKFQYYVGPRFYEPYSETYFLSWQAAVEQTFIFLRSNQNGSDFEVMMQRFPYPPYDDNFISNALDVIVMCFTYSFILFFTILVKRVVQEKANRSKELLKMMGMNDYNYWTSTFFNYFFVALIINLIVAIMYTSPLPNSAKVLEKTNFFLLFVIFLLYIASCILFCLAVTTVFNRPNLAVTVVMILLVVPQMLLFAFYFVNNFNSKFFELSLGSKLGICLIPGGAIQVAFKLSSILISSGEGMSWSSLNSFTALPDINLAMVMLMMLVSCILFSVIIWYVDAVWPWQYGVPKPFYFPFTKSYWCGPSKDHIEEFESLNINTEFFEADPLGITPGIIIKNLSKVFKSGIQPKTAVDNISLNIYSGQITALLGRNGAGKTTTVNMLTGLYTPSGGSASICGWDIHSNMKNARQSLGICPQDNILFPVLTVEQHLKLIAGMKGVEWRNISSESERVLKLVNLEEKRNVLAQNLSGGMKRKLCLGLAIIGNSKVLFLDEPTSGMDPENRRMLWDILLGIRHDKTIVLTTHYMEEADILGDRIAIMVDGKIKCCGSPVFLKRKFGTGYHLNIIRNSSCDLAALTALLKEYIPQAVLASSAEAELQYDFSDDVSGRCFASLFSALESQKSELGINSFGMTLTTMDDVFLKVNTVDEVKFNDYAHLSGNGNGNELLESDGGNFLIQPLAVESGWKLWTSCICGSLLKRWSYTKRHWSVVLYQFVFPFCILCIFLAVLRNSIASRDSPPPLTLNLQSVYGESEGVYKPDASTEQFATSSYLPLLRENGVQVSEREDLQKYIIDYGTKDLTKYLKTLLVGGSSSAKSNSSLHFTAWYNGEPFHTLPMSLNIMHTAIARYLTGDQKIWISLTNAPFPSVSVSSASYNEMFFRMMASIFMPLALGYMSASYISVAIQECASKAKLLQIMTGMSAFTYWLGMFVWDMLTHSIASIVLLIPFAIFLPSVFFVHSEAIGTSLLLLLLFGWSSIPLCYIFSRWISKPATGYSVILCVNTVIGLVAVQLMSSFYDVAADNPKFLTALFFLRLLPIFSVSYGFAQVVVVAFLNTFCGFIPPRVLKYYCTLPKPPDNVIPCCKDKCGNHCLTQISPVSWNEGCGKDLLYLAVDGLLFFALLLFLETGIMGKFLEFILARLPWKRSINAPVVTPSTDYDMDVLQETQRIENTDPRATTEEALVTVGLTKHYGSLCAVDHLTFAVHKQECFGLLGVNGAGKTSTFMMLTGDVLPSKGNAFINGYSLRSELKKFQSFIGYCPQYDALIDRLTGREMLKLFATLRGIPSKSIDHYISMLIKNIDLQEHADKQTRFYSGGNKRKLSLAIALIGCPPLILLDEPTSGVDPVSRRKIWDILSRARELTGTAIVLCTHSMEECEALCSRLSIMVKGQFRCLGSIQYLKSKFGQGFTVVVKFKNKHCIDNMTVDAVKREFTKAFPSSNLKDCHQGVLNFHITDPSIPWSYLFHTMENTKEIFDLEDYFISGTSLEQIFLSFAQYQ